jgi:hypothetical protein
MHEPRSMAENFLTESNPMICSKPRYLPTYSSALRMIVPNRVSRRNMHDILLFPHQMTIHMYATGIWIHHSYYRMMIPLHSDSRRTVMSLNIYCQPPNICRNMNRRGINLSLRYSRTQGMKLYLKLTTVNHSSCVT